MGMSAPPVERTIETDATVRTKREPSTEEGMPTNQAKFEEALAQLCNEHGVTAATGTFSFTYECCGDDDCDGVVDSIHISVNAEDQDLFTHCVSDHAQFMKRIVEPRLRDWSNKNKLEKRQEAQADVDAAVAWVAENYPDFPIQDAIDWLNLHMDLTIGITVNKDHPHAEKYEVLGEDPQWEKIFNNYSEHYMKTLREETKSQVPDNPLAAGMDLLDDPQVIL